MSRSRPPDQVAELRAEVARLEKIIAALIKRAETHLDQRPSDFGVFQATVLLEDQVRSRTQELDSAMRQLAESNRALHESKAKFQAVFDFMPNPVALSALDDSTLLEVSRSFAEFFGYRREEMIGRHTGPEDLALWADPAQREHYRAAVAASAGSTFRFEGRARRRNGELANVILSGRLVTVDGRSFLVSEFHDVTEAKRHGERLRMLAEHDALTGLPNRLLVLDRLNIAMAQARRSGAQLAVCYLDLDGFKAVNDHFGHHAGDLVLIEAARRLSTAVRASDSVGRLGGDEFAILLPGMAASGEFDLVLGRILKAIRQPYMVDDQVVDGIGASIGFTVFPDDDSTPQMLLAHADQTMYRAKRAGKNRYRRFGTDGPSLPAAAATP